ncbi:MAG: hypothetical protein KDI02_24080 [Anaerolineae bacterium]|nr:hypothetical protein [Anaerolineae bacterium]MCB0181348.1 hypothetical protein [Anaerolineae bacterium]MCB0226796.1 hypothetical protein [Anaerolineae bacterium]MCB9105068.1 hypothetical protein [Anaerolineales bacterium]
MVNNLEFDTALKKYSPWFYAAALYNFIWGSVTILFPTLFFELIDVPQPIHLSSLVAGGWDVCVAL